MQTFLTVVGLIVLLIVCALVTVHLVRNYREEKARVAKVAEELRLRREAEARARREEEVRQAARRTAAKDRLSKLVSANRPVAKAVAPKPAPAKSNVRRTVRPTPQGRNTSYPSYNNSGYTNRDAYGQTEVGYWENGIWIAAAIGMASSTDGWTSPEQNTTPDVTPDTSSFSGGDSGTFDSGSSDFSGGSSGSYDSGSSSSYDSGSSSSSSYDSGSSSSYDSGSSSSYDSGSSFGGGDSGSY